MTHQNVIFYYDVAGHLRLTGYHRKAAANSILYTVSIHTVYFLSTVLALLLLTSCLFLIYDHGIMEPMVFCLLIGFWKVL